MRWKEDRFLVVSSFFAKSNEARRNNHQKGRYAFKRAFDRGEEASFIWGLHIFTISGTSLLYSIAIS
jgi:hypothetical protein